MSFRMAARQAERSLFKQHRVGAVIVKGGNILSTGFNSIRPSKILGTKTLHAEAAAVLKLLKQRRLHDLAGSEVYVTRFTRGGRVGMAKPCPACQQLLQSVGVQRVVYTDNNGNSIVEKI